MEEKSMYSQYRWAMLASVCLAIISIYIDMIAYAPILGDIAKDLKVDMGTATNLMMGFVLVAGIVLAFGGTVCDKYGVTTAMILGLACSTVPATFMPMIGTSYGAVLVARLIQGCAVGFVFAVIGPVMALWFPPKEQGMASGLMIGAISMGSALGVITSPQIFAATGSWQTTIAIMSVVGWAALILAFAVTRKAPNPEVVNAVVSAMQAGAGTLTFGKAMTMPATWIATFVMVCNAWGLYCLYNLVPPYLAAPAPMGVGLGPATAGAISVALTLIGLFAMIIGGIVFDKVFKGNPKPAILIGFIMAAICIYLILVPGVYTSMALLIICLMVAGWGVPWMSPAISAFVAMTYPPAIIGRMIGWVFGIGTLGGALGLYLGGNSIGATGSFRIAITMIALASVVGLILGFFVRPRQA